MSEMTPQEEQLADDRLLDSQIDAHLEYEAKAKIINLELSALLRQVVPCQHGPCAECGSSGIDPSYLAESRNGQSLVYIVEVGKVMPGEPVEVPDAPF